MPDYDPTSLDVDALLGEARATAALDDFEDTSFREALGVLVASLDSEAQLSTAGRFAQHARIVDLLVNRLRVEEAFRHHPEINDEDLGAPLVIVGLARTGTTMLHRLLSSDPRHHAVAWWENRNPAPFPGADPDAPDPRIAVAHEQVRAILEAAPELAAIHPWDPEGPDEEILLMEHSFLSTTPPSFANVPTYDAWAKAQDQAPSYAYLTKMLRFLQWQKRGRDECADRWVLKTPHHLGFVEYLFEAFPGATVVQTHRDPLETIPSISSMYLSLHRMGSDAVDPAVVGDYCRRHYGAALAHCMAARDRLPADRFIDVDYRSVVRDPMAAVRAIYDAAGVELTDDAVAEMSRWAGENRRDKRAAHDYSLEQFGFDASSLAEEFALYRSRHLSEA